MNRAYALAVLERAIKSAAQAALLVFGADQLDALHAQWADVAGFAAGGFVLSVLTSLATSGLGSGDGPSATTEVIAPQHRGEVGQGYIGLAIGVLLIVVLVVLILRLA